MTKAQLLAPVGESGLMSPHSDPSAEGLLAVVIPAYKADFLSETLASLALQEGIKQPLRVYIGDDASPSDIEGVCKAFSSRLDIQYTRFPGNLGQTDLPGHWNRCVRLANEPWVWLFGDDDIMEPKCVSRLLQAIESEGSSYDLFHFNVNTIDANGSVLHNNPPFPGHLSAHAFASARLKFELASFAPDYIFSRAAFDHIGGFVRFPLAWCTDDATWLAIAGTRGIRTLAGPRVCWRLSGQNISSRSPGTTSRKLDAYVQYLIWLHRYLGSIPAPVDGPTVADVMEYSPSWLYSQMRIMRGNFWPRHGWSVAWRLRHLPNHGLMRDIIQTIRFDLGSR